MGKNENRRNLLKTTSLSVAVIFILSFSLWSSASDSNSRMVPIVMVTDSRSFVDGVVDQDIVQGMVDTSIIILTGVVGDLPLAYQSLFPNVTASTKILLNYNPKTCITGRCQNIQLLCIR